MLQTLSEVSDCLSQALSAIAKIIEPGEGRRSATEALRDIALLTPLLCESRRDPVVNALLSHIPDAPGDKKQKLKRAAMEWALPFGEDFATADYHAERLVLARSFPPIPRGADSWHRLGHWLCLHVHEQFGDLCEYVANESAFSINLDAAIRLRSRRNRKSLPPVALVVEVQESIEGELGAVGSLIKEWVSLAELSRMFVHGLNDEHPGVETIRMAIKPTDVNQLSEKERKAIPRSIKKNKKWFVHLADALRYFPESKGWRLASPK